MSIPNDSVIISRAEYDDFKNLERRYNDLNQRIQRHDLDDERARGKCISHSARFITRDDLIGYGDIYAPIGTPVVYREVKTTVEFSPAFSAVDSNARVRAYRLVETCMRTGRNIYQEQ